MDRRPWRKLADRLPRPVSGLEVALALALLALIAALLLVGCRAGVAVPSDFRPPPTATAPTPPANEEPA